MIRFVRNIIMTAGRLYNESGSSTHVRFQGNLEVGDIRFGSNQENRIPPVDQIMKSLVESFEGTVKKNDLITGIGFKPFDPTLAGLPPGSRLLEKAKQARRGAASGSSEN